MMYDSSEKNIKLTNKDKKQLEKDISSLTLSQHGEILNIIRNNNQTYSENNTGIYFNLKYINDKTALELINYVKTCKVKEINDENIIDKTLTSTNNNELIDDSRYKIDISDIHAELCKFNSKEKDENFTFQNFLDKLSITNIKSFSKNDKIEYPQLKQCKTKLYGVNERLVKKCKDNIREEDNYITDTDISDNYLNNFKNLEKTNTEITENNINFDLDNGMDDDTPYEIEEDEYEIYA